MRAPVSSPRDLVGDVDESLLKAETLKRLQFLLEARNGGAKSHHAPPVDAPQHTAFLAPSETLMETLSTSRILNLSTSGKGFALKGDTILKAQDKERLKLLLARAKSDADTQDWTRSSDGHVDDASPRENGSGSVDGSEHPTEIIGSGAEGAADVRTDVRSDIRSQGTAAEPPGDHLLHVDQQSQAVALPRAELDTSGGTGEERRNGSGADGWM